MQGFHGIGAPSWPQFIFHLRPYAERRAHGERSQVLAEQLLQPRLGNVAQNHQHAVVELAELGVQVAVHAQRQVVAQQVHVLGGRIIVAGAHGAVDGGDNAPPAQLRAFFAQPFALLVVEERRGVGPPVARIRQQCPKQQFHLFDRGLPGYAKVGHRGPAGHVDTVGRQHVAEVGRTHSGNLAQAGHVAHEGAFSGAQRRHVGVAALQQQTVVDHALASSPLIHHPRAVREGPDAASGHRVLGGRAQLNLAPSGPQQAQRIGVAATVDAGVSRFQHCRSPGIEEALHKSGAVKLALRRVAAKFQRPARVQQCRSEAVEKPQVPFGRHLPAGEEAAHVFGGDDAGVIKESRDALVGYGRIVLRQREFAACGRQHLHSGVRKFGNGGSGCVERRERFGNGGSGFGEPVHAEVNGEFVAFVSGRRGTVPVAEAEVRQRNAFVGEAVPDAFFQNLRQLCRVHVRHQRLRGMQAVVRGSGRSPGEGDAGRAGTVVLGVDEGRAFGRIPAVFLLGNA